MEAAVEQTTTTMEQTTTTIEQTTTTMEAAIEQTTTTATTTSPVEQTTITSAVEQTTNTNAVVAAGGADQDGDGGPKDITVAKGKRTKRQRPQSPILFTFSSSTNINDLMNYSPVSSSGFPAGSTTTEDEDTAESLILLSKGQSLEMSPRKNNNDYEGIYKFNSKKYIQSPATGAAGFFVYECKTCSRTFPSFQALGGHRASHKKPKNNEETRKPPPYTVVIDNNEPDFISRNNNYSLSLQLNTTTTKSFSKLHECSICGTEFNSGQALGGHMRRHRVPGGGSKAGNSSTNNNCSNANNTTLSLIPFTAVTTAYTTAEVYDRKSKNDALCLGLDLNLPAPRETTTAAGDDEQRQKRSFALSATGENEKKQQPAVHLSEAPTLMVDCHY